MYEENYIKGIANTIISQMGGYSKLKAMVNARDFSCGRILYNEFEQPYVKFKFSLNPKITSCMVIYDEGLDIYIMRFFNRANNIVKEITDVYCDELIYNFQETTKLNLILF